MVATNLCTQADGLDLKANVLAAYVAAGLSKEVPDLMTAMKITPKSSFEVR
jgi:signal recognition particle subunit SRP72